jgi:F-type H+-transporting ATPase subunit a
MHISLAPEIIFTLFGLPVTNSMIMTWLTMILIAVVGFLAARQPQLVPGKLQNFVESLFEIGIDFIDRVIQDRALTYRIFPLLMTFFLLILLSNWLGLVPGVGPIGYLEEVHGKAIIVPWLRPTNADINSTLSWAIISVVMVQVFGIITLGLAGHLGKFINIKALAKGNFEGFTNFAIGILEIFSEISKIISFSFRLFGNIFAGEVLLTVIAFLVPYVAPIPFYFLELFVGFIQAVVFTTLSLVFIKIATTSHDHSHQDHHESGAVSHAT